MKRFHLLALTLLLPFCLFGANSALAQASDFPGVQEAMSPQAYSAAGLNKLSADERAKLDEFIRGYVSTSSQKAATAAVDKAVEERKAGPPEVIESSIVGTFSGYNGRSRFTLENGQVWAQSQQVSRIFPRLENPPVLIVKGKSTLAGYRMYIAGGGNIRVSRVK